MKKILSVCALVAVVWIASGITFGFFEHRGDGFRGEIVESGWIARPFYFWHGGFGHRWGGRR